MKKLKENLQAGEEIVVPVSNKTFVITDLGIAAALVTANFELTAMDRENPRKVKFIFRRETGIEKVADDFWSDSLEQKSRSFWDNVRTLKNRLHSND